MVLPEPDIAARGLGYTDGPRPESLRGMGAEGVGKPQANSRLEGGGWVGWGSLRRNGVSLPEAGMGINWAKATEVE